jgi:hypothetical protein
MGWFSPDMFQEQMLTLKPVTIERTSTQTQQHKLLNESARLKWVARIKI